MRVFSTLLVATLFLAACASGSQAPQLTATPTEALGRLLVETTMGGEESDVGINLIQAQDGGYALLGYTSSFGSGGEDIYLIRTSSEGEVLWSQTYGGGGQDNGWDLVETEDGGFTILGFSDSFSDGDMDFYLVRTDATGEEQWSQTYGGPEEEYGWAMVQTPTGGYALAGQTTSFGAGAEDAYIVVVDDEGQEVWSQAYGGEDTDRVFAIESASDGGYVVAGITNSFGAGSRDAYVLKVNEAGEQDWDLVVGEAPDDVAHAISATADGGYIVIGYTRSFGASNYNSLLMKVSAAGELEWQSIFGGPGEDHTISGQQTQGGGYVLGGYTQNYGARNWDAYLVKTDAAGAAEQHHIFGDTAEDRGYTVIETREGNFAMIGHTFSAGEGSSDVYFLVFEAKE